MSGEIEPYEGGKLDRQARREIERLGRTESIRRSEIELTENVAAYEISTRLANGYYLTAQAQGHVNSLSQNVDRTTKDKPGLEMQQRELADTYALSAGQLIHGYMNRRRKYSR